MCRNIVRTAAKCCNTSHSNLLGGVWVENISVDYFPCRQVSSFPFGVCVCGCVSVCVQQCRCTFLSVGDFYTSWSTSSIFQFKSQSDSCYCNCKQDCDGNLYNNLPSLSDLNFFILIYLLVCLDLLCSKACKLYHSL